MGKELATTPSRYVQALYNISTGSASFDGRDLLKLGKEDGYWSFGQENHAIDEENDIFAVNPESFREGYIAFDEKGNDVATTEDGTPADFLWKLGDAPHIDDHEDAHPLPAPKNARTKPVAYRYQLAIELVCVGGTNKGVRLVYKNTSQGCLDMLAKLAGEIGRRKENGDEACVPAIQLYAEDYMHRTYGRIWKPKAEIFDWYTMDDEVMQESDPRKAEKSRENRAVVSESRAEKTRALAPMPEPDEGPAEEPEETQAAPARERGRERGRERTERTPAREKRHTPLVPRAERDEEPEPREDAEAPRGRRASQGARESRR